jgi:potassium-transporting ATPase KdpC subunit
MTVLLTLISGIVDPLAMTGLAQLVLPEQANGSLIVRDGRVAGLELRPRGP